MKKGFKKACAIALMGAMTVSLAACGSSGSESTSGSAGSSGGGDTIRFAVVGPMTGNSAQTGLNQQYGIQLAVDEINALGGINGKQLEYDVFDDQANPNQAVICGEKIVADGGYDFVVAPVNSGCSLSMYPTLLEYDMPIISGVNTSDSLSEQGFKNYLRIPPTDGAMMEQLIDTAVKDFGSKKPAVIYSSAEADVNCYEQSVAYLKDNYGVEYVGAAEVQVETEKDFTAHITNFMNAGADALFFFGEYDLGGLLLNQKYSAGFDVPMFTRSGCSNVQIIEIAGDQAAESLYTMACFDPSNPDEKVQNFVKNFTELAGFEPCEQASGAYDVIYMLYQTLNGNEEAAALRGNELVEYLRANAVLDGVMVDVDGFDENGDNPLAKAVVLSVQDGKFVVYQ